MDVTTYSPSDLQSSLSISKLYPFILSGVIGTGLGRMLNYTGVKKVGASINGAFMSASPVIATILAFIFISENFGFVQGIGIALLTLGLIMVGYSGGGNKSGWSKKLLLFPVLAMFAYGSGAVLRRYGLENTLGNPIQATATNEIIAFFVIGFYVVAFTDLSVTRFLKSKNINIFYAALLNTVGIASLFASLNFGTVIIATTFSSLSTVVTLIGTYFELGDVESVSTAQIVGTLVALSSTLLIVLGA